MSQDNPLMRVYVRMNQGDGPVFKPEVEIGVTDDELMDFVASIVGGVIFDREHQHALNTPEELAYMLSVGVVIGVNFEREKHV